MAGEEKNLLAASTNVEEATATPTVIDEDELAKARVDERWREFCLNAEQYVAETTRAALASHPHIAANETTAGPALR